VETLPQRDEFFLAGKLFAQTHCPFDGLRAAVAEKGSSSWPGVISARRLAKRAAVDQLVHLRFRRGDAFGVIVTGVDDGDAAETVEVILAIADGKGRA
jgi:hypothetical protein